MKKQLGICVMTAAVAGVVFAQPPAATSDVTTTAVEAIKTTSTAIRTSATATASGRFSSERFEKRWAMEKKMYQEAGIAHEKIQQIHALNLELWQKRAQGIKIDFKELARKRNGILTKEEMGKLRSSRRDIIKKRLSAGDKSTTASGKIR